LRIDPKWSALATNGDMETGTTAYPSTFDVWDEEDLRTTPTDSILLVTFLRI
jgi:hypothetical protein